MLCQKCHSNPASVRYSEVVDGRVSHIQLCPSCLSARQEEPRGGFELGDSPTFSRGTRKAPAASVATAISNETCKVCETDLRTILQTGVVGCGACYESFPAQLESLLEGIHTALIHRGKTPRAEDARSRHRTDLQSKRALLKTALGSENYEDAAGLRDDIRRLEEGLRLSDTRAN